jgi:hypothetical protein
MDAGVRAVLLTLGVVFIVAFGGLTIAALASATANFASILMFGLSFLVLGVALFGLIGAIRNPPDEDR